MSTNLLRDNSPRLAIREIQDLIVRKNFENLQAYFNSENQLLGFKFFEVEFTGATSNLKLSHGLPSIPQDILVSQIRGTVTFNCGLFSNTQLDISSSGAGRIRFYVGTYWDSPQQTPFAPTDVMVFSSGTAASGATSGTSSSVPTGTILSFGGSVLPSGFLWCDGKAYSQDLYPDLFAAIGIAFGGTGPGLFSVPQSQGYFMRGRNNATGNDPDAAARTQMTTGGNTGDKVGSIQSYSVESHTHGLNRTTANFQTNDTSAIRTISAGTQVATAAYGGNETRPKNFYVNYIIKT